MTLTVCIGASGSGKTTFLNDVYNSHKCVYIRQYHNLRPYITVSQIPAFDPTQLPYWDIYVREGKDKSIQVGGTMGGKFYAGISGGQRKMLLFELIYQRTKDQEDLLIVLDEPFAGVTDDFIPFIVDRLNLMRNKHSILLVTNDHVQTLTSMSDNTITVSAIDRSTVKINNREKVDRKQTLLAMSIGDAYSSAAAKNSDLKFFYNVEIRMNGDIIGVLVFAIIAFILFVATFWDSTPKYSEPLVMIAGGIIAYFCVNPYLLGLVDWRNLIVEETEALLHSSAGKMKALKTMFTIFLVFIISCIEFGVINLVINTLRDGKYFVAIFFDSASLTFPLICVSLYTTLPFQPAQILGAMPFLLMIFFSTTFSPSSGVEFFNYFRYLFARFYFWCLIPGVGQLMEGCPTTLNILYLILAGLLNVFLFLCIKLIFALFDNRKRRLLMEDRKKSMMNEGFLELQTELFGSKALKRLKHISSMNSIPSSNSLTALCKQMDVSKDTIDEKTSDS